MSEVKNTLGEDQQQIRHCERNTSNTLSRIKLRVGMGEGRERGEKGRKDR